MSNFSTRLRELRKDRKLRQSDLAENIGVAQTTIANYEQNIRFPDESILGRISDYFEVSLDYLLGRTDIKDRYLSAPRDRTREMASEEGLSQLAGDYMALLLKGSLMEAARLIEDALKEDWDIRKVYREVFEATLKEIGRLWESNKADVSTEHHFSASTQSIMSMLRPYIKSPGSNGHTVVSLSVGGEMHNIGVRMVNDFLEMEGFKTYYLGGDLPTQNVVNAIKSYDADLLVVSVTMPFNLDRAANLIRAIRGVKEFRRIKILIGGQAFESSGSLWKDIGADGYAADAHGAPSEAKRLIGGLDR